MLEQVCGFKGPFSQNTAGSPFAQESQNFHCLFLKSLESLEYLRKLADLSTTSVSLCGATVYIPEGQKSDVKLHLLNSFFKLMSI